VLQSNSGRPASSTRIAVSNMLPFLRETGFDGQVVFEPAGSTAAPAGDDAGTP
jgi:hypothetical protein